MQMPIGEFASNPLPDCVVAIVRAWIAEGAPGPASDAGTDTDWRLDLASRELADQLRRRAVRGLPGGRGAGARKEAGAWGRASGKRFD
jgi:hypothetical protein